MNLLQDNKPAKTQEEKDAEAARDKAYQDSLKKIPDAKPPADPWGNVRTTDTPKAPAKAAASAKAEDQDRQHRQLKRAACTPRCRGCCASCGSSA